ncbi:MAG: DUF2807 domain-containing protein [Prevotellaceae bacterium]|jgi:hypothetical protein|nr:DUF2807 domain-containing protein [Prevotellaceae bacterium]
MKKQLLSIGLIFVVLLSISLTGWAIPRRITGSGNVVKEERNVKTFSGIKASSVFKIYIRQGSPQSLVVEADDNIIDLIKSDVYGNILELSLRSNSNIKNPTKMDIYITMEKLTELDLSGAANIQFETPIDAGQEIEIEMSGAATIKDATIKAGKIDLDMSGAASVTSEITCTNLKIDASGAAKINLSGTADVKSIEASGATTVKVKNVKSNKSKISASGAAYVLTAKSENANISSSGAASVKTRD